MPRIIALDYGLKRCGLATTDPMKIIATPLDSVEAPQLMTYLTAYCRREETESLVIGQPIHADGTPTYLEDNIQQFIKAFAAEFPSIKIERVDERNTSKIARSQMIGAGYKKKERENKALLDKLSALEILKIYMNWW